VLAISLALWMSVASRVDVEPEQQQQPVSFAFAEPPQPVPPVPERPPARVPAPVAPRGRSTAAAQGPAAAAVPESPVAAASPPPEAPPPAGKPQGAPFDPPALRGPAPEAPGAEPSERSFDVRRALREFDPERVERPAAPEAPAPGRGAGGGFVPDVGSLPKSGFGMDGLAFESRDYDWTDYQRQIYVAIWRAWHRRLWMTTDDFEKWAHATGRFYLDDRTQVRFVIERSGEVTGIAEEAASACDPLDASAVDALDEVILPPLPADFPRDREIVHARFIATGWIGDMRTHFERLRRAGYF
jgi:hypothetical protein